MVNICFILGVWNFGNYQVKGVRITYSNKNLVAESLTDSPEWEYCTCITALFASRDGSILGVSAHGRERAEEARKWTSSDSTCVFLPCWPCNKLQLWVQICAESWESFLWVTEHVGTSETNGKPKCTFGWSFFNFFFFDMKLIKTI